MNEEEEIEDENYLDTPIKFNLYLEGEVRQPFIVSQEDETFISNIEDYRLDEHKKVICFTAKKYGETNILVTNGLRTIATLKIVLTKEDNNEISYSVSSPYYEYTSELKIDNYIEREFSPLTVDIYSYKNYDTYENFNALSAVSKDTSMIDILQVDKSGIKISIKKTGSSVIELYDENKKIIYSVFVIARLAYYTFSVPLYILCDYDGGVNAECQFKSLDASINN